MTRTGFRRKAILLLLAAVLFFPWALLGRTWGFIATIWEKEGCHLDPDGLCTPVKPAPTIQTDTGCHIDPNGGCRS